MQQNADLAEITSTFAKQSTNPNPIEFINGQVLELIASLKATGDQLFEKTHKIDEKLDQVEAQFHQHLHQSSQKIYAEIERSRNLSANSLNEIRQTWETKLNETAEIYAHENRQIIADGQRALSESIGTLNGDSEKALHSYVNRLEAQLAEAKEHHKSVIADFKKQLSNDFESFIKETRQELDSAKEGAKNVFDRKLETLLKSLSDSAKEIENNKTIVDGFVEKTGASLQSMAGEFQSQHDLKINKAAEKLSEWESKADKLLMTINSEFENRWLNLVNTHNQNLKSFKDSLKEAIVAKVAQQSKKRLDYVIKEFQEILNRINNNQETLRHEILSINQICQAEYIQNENSIKKLYEELINEKSKSRLWILFVTLFFSLLFIYYRYFISS
jgi:hypothetical protein